MTKNAACYDGLIIQYDDNITLFNLNIKFYGVKIIGGPWIIY